MHPMPGSLFTYHNRGGLNLTPPIMYCPATSRWVCRPWSFSHLRQQGLHQSYTPMLQWLPIVRQWETNKNTPWGRDIARIISKLHVIDNNTAATIGGGPVHDFRNRRAPMAPDFTKSNSIKILPIGNSLTENNAPGYRGYLYQKLKESGYKY